MPPSTFFAVVTIGVIGLYLAFAVPIYYRWKAGDDFTPGGWTLGTKYKWMSIARSNWNPWTCWPTKRSADGRRRGDERPGSVVDRGAGVDQPVARRAEVMPAEQELGRTWTLGRGGNDDPHRRA